MKSTNRLFCLLFVLLIAVIPMSANAHCNTTPDLSATSSEFEVGQTSRIDALLRFGEIHKLCFGIEYVDATLLTELANFHLRPVPIRDAIRSILGEQRLFAVQLSNGVIEITEKTPEGGKKSVFDYVIPKFETRRGQVQEISIGLHMQLVADLNPQITGFAGHYPTGNLKDQIGPFAEYNRTLRYLLDEITAQSTGGAWIARVPWGLRGDFAMPERHRIWTIVEYGAPSSGYAGLLRGIAAELESDAHIHTTAEPKQ